MHRRSWMHAWSVVEWGMWMVGLGQHIASHRTSNQCWYFVECNCWKLDNRSTFNEWDSGSNPIPCRMISNSSRVRFSFNLLLHGVHIHFIIVSGHNSQVPPKRHHKPSARCHRRGCMRNTHTQINFSWNHHTWASSSHSSNNSISNNSSSNYRTYVRWVRAVRLLLLNGIELRWNAFRCYASYGSFLHIHPFVRLFMRRGCH